MNLAIGLRNLRRVREIVSVLVLDYGFGYVFDQFDLARFFPLGRRRGIAREYAHLSGPERLRLALGELGPTFIKLGQVLSARADLLPPPVVAELRRLQDEAPAIPFEELRGIIETELGRPLEQCFEHIDPTPMSAASLGQVHGATLRDGRQVTVKVLRPGVNRIVESDVQILFDVAHILHRQVPSLQRYQLPTFVRRFATQIEDELVYTLEAHNGERLARNLESAGMKVRLPAVIWSLTTRRVLTTERVQGRRVDRLFSPPATFDKAAVAAELARCRRHQMFVDGFFHGDPHQGNVLFEEDGTILLLDWGIVGHLDLRMRRLLAEGMLRVYQDDVDGLVMVMSELGTVGPDTDLAALRADAARILNRFVTLPRQEFPMGELLTSVLRTMWTHHIHLPPELSLVGKALLMTEGICRELDPNFDSRSVAEPVVEEARKAMFSAAAISEQLFRALEAAGRRLAKLPARLDNVLSLLERGNLRLRIEDPGADNRWSMLTRSLNRLALSILAGALLLCSALYLSSAATPLQLGLGVSAMVAGMLLGLVLVLALMRPGRL
jgi:ubiquinone biosynthesis protein